MDSVREWGSTNYWIKIASRVYCATRGIEIIFCSNCKWKLSFKNCIENKKYLNKKGVSTSCSVVCHLYIVFSPRWRERKREWMKLVLQNNYPTFSRLMVMKTKEKLRSHHGPEETKEI